jgi:hypothetical protein
MTSRSNGEIRGNMANSSDILDVDMHKRVSSHKDATLSGHCSRANALMVHIRDCSVSDRARGRLKLCHERAACVRVLTHARAEAKAQSYQVAFAARMQ